MEIRKKDNGGVLAKLDEIEFSTNMDWESTLSKITDQETIICTYGEPDADYNPFFKKHLGHMTNVMIVNGFNSKLVKQEVYYEKLKKFNDNAKVYVNDNTHAKFLLIAPNEVYVTSQNVGYSDWLQVTVHIKDMGAFDFYKNIIYEYVESQPKSVNHNYILPYLAPEKQGVSTNVQSKYDCSISVKSQLCKLFRMPNWNAKFNNIKNKHFTICTYTLPSYEYAKMAINKLLNNGNSIQLIMNSKFESVAKQLEDSIAKDQFKYACHPKIHAKIVLCDNLSVWIGSHNFGNSGWFESLFQIKYCSEAYDYYTKILNNYIKNSDITNDDSINPTK